MENVHTGLLRFGRNGDNSEILLLDDMPLAEKLRDMNGRIVNVNYYVSKEKVSVERASELFFKSTHSTHFGRIEAEFFARYSEKTDTLWVEEELTIGGHDLLDELKKHTGEYLMLHVKVYRERVIQ